MLHCKGKPGSRYETLDLNYVYTYCTGRAKKKTKLVVLLMLQFRFVVNNCRPKPAVNL